MVEINRNETVYMPMNNATHPIYNECENVIQPTAVCDNVQQVSPRIQDATTLPTRFGKQ